MAYNPKSLANLKKGGIKGKEAQDAQAKGVEKRREKKTLREIAEIIGSLPAKVICPDGTEMDDATLDVDLVMQQYKKAHNGDTKAARFIMKLKGEDIDKHEVTGADGAPLFTGFRDILPQMPNIEKIIAERDKEHEDE